MVSPRNRFRTALNGRGGQTNPLQKARIADEQGGKCAYCGKRGPGTIDHVIPISMGGPNAGHNKVFACMPCNSEKGWKMDVVWMTRGIQALILRGQDVSWIDDYRFPWQDSADHELEKKADEQE